MTCDCVPPPPVFDLEPPPDPSLVWHLLSDEIYEKPDDCEWNPFISIRDVNSKVSAELDFDRLPLLLCALAAVLLLCILCTVFALRLRRKNDAELKKKKTTSADHILTASDNLWSYNSMKTSGGAVSQHGSMGVLMYGGSQTGGSMVFHKNLTPAAIRSLRPADSMIRQPHSTTLRLQHTEAGNYHTVGRTYEQYEEIPNLRATAYTPAPGCAIIHDRWPSTPPRGSIRKPPPTCRPPPPPQDEYVQTCDVRPKFHSPNASDSSLEHELTGIPTESPPLKRWEDPEVARSRLSGENGRESGYGTAPSRQWRSPPNSSGGRPSEAPGLVLTHNPDAHSMTYV